MRVARFLVICATAVVLLGLVGCSSAWTADEPSDDLLELVDLLDETDPKPMPRRRPLVR